MPKFNPYGGPRRIHDVVRTLDGEAPDCPKRSPATPIVHGFMTRGMRVFRLNDDGSRGELLKSLLPVPGGFREIDLA